MNVNDELMNFEAAALDKVHCGDCLTLMGKMPASSIGLIVTSPPLQLEEQHRQRIERRTRRQVAESRIDPRLPGPRGRPAR